MRKKRLEVTQLEDPEELAELEPEPEPTPLLVLKYNEVELQRFPIYGECLVGRAKECDIQIAERRLSRRHCKLTHENGRVVLRDLGSQNGTYVNRRRIPAQYQLEHGDVLNFAEYAILYLSDAADYDGPDRENVSVPVAPRPSSGIEKEETEYPEAYDGPSGLVSNPKAPSILPNDHEPLQPQDLEDPDDVEPAAPVKRMPKKAPPEDPAEPFVERPRRSRERRTRRPDEEVEVTPARDAKRG